MPHDQCHVSHLSCSPQPSHSTSFAHDARQRRCLPGHLNCSNIGTPSRVLWRGWLAVGTPMDALGLDAAILGLLLPISKRGRPCGWLSCVYFRDHNLVINATPLSCKRVCACSIMCYVWQKKIGTGSFGTKVKRWIRANTVQPCIAT